VLFFGMMLFVPTTILAATATATDSTNAVGAASISGVVDDAQTGLPLAGATVRIIDSGAVATTDRNGAFSLGGLASGKYRLRIERDGYQPTDSTQIQIDPGAAQSVTLSIQSAPTAAAGALRTIGSTSVRATQSLQTSSTIYRTISPDILLDNGAFRAGDALRQLPGINNSISGDTASLGDDLQLQIRGLGGAETLSMLDGHPIAYGVPGGFNYQLSPAFGLRNITVTYGSAGTELTGYDAIGGIIDSQTIEPTKDPRTSFIEGYGTFDRALTAISTTGTLGRLGYAFEYGVGSLDGPFHQDYFYQPGAAYDPSATDPAVRDLAVYKDDGTAVSRNGLEKLRYDFTNSTHLTLTAFQSSYWEDKTGNGDGDYLTPSVALAEGKTLLGQKAATDACPAGEFTAYNANGVAWGTGPGGVPDGGAPCQTPSSYASDVAGWQGAGPAWQSFNVDDEALHFETGSAKNSFRFDTFTDRYLNTNDRTFELPFNEVPGDNASYRNTNVVTTGGTLSDNVLGRNNEFAFGFEYLNSAYDLRRNGDLRGAPIVHETGEFVRDAYHAVGSPLAAYASVYFKRSTTTNSSYNDPRLSVVYTVPGGHDVFRAAAGATTTEPTADLVDQLFTPSNLVTAGGGGGITCGGLNSIGSAPSSLLKPERGVDEELAYGHRFVQDSQVQLEFYNTNVYDKIYSSLTPLSTTGTGFISPEVLSSAEALIGAKCGVPDSETLLGVSGSVNLGQLRAQGFTLSGRQRIDPRTFVDYDYATTSTVLVSAPVQYLENNLTSVIGAQVPYLPLHTLSFAVDRQLTPRFDLRYTLHAVSDNNNKHSAGYNYSELRGSLAVAGGTLSANVFNLFNQDAFLQGYLGEGVPLALNQYATKASYAPYLGANATELFGLPYRSFFVSYSLQVR
jgi:hypothetical protein